MTSEVITHDRIFSVLNIVPIHYTKIRDLPENVWDHPDTHILDDIPDIRSRIGKDLTALDVARILTQVACFEMLSGRKHDATDGVFGINYIVVARGADGSIGLAFHDVDAEAIGYTWENTLKRLIKCNLIYGYYSLLINDGSRLEIGEDAYSEAYKNGYADAIYDSGAD